VNLTNPALLLYREELPAERTSRNYYLQIITHLQSYKAAFCDDRVWAILSVKLGNILQIVSTNVCQQLLVLISLYIYILKLLEIKPSLTTIVQDILFSFSLQLRHVSAHINGHLQAICIILNIKN
jgi:hypothetical protein